MVRIFRKRFLVQENIQFLIFRQFISKNKNMSEAQKNKTTYKSMRTNDLRDVREAEIEALDDTTQMDLSKH